MHIGLFAARCRSGDRRSRQNHHSSSGLSLVELLVVVALIGMVVLGAGITWQRSRGRAEAKAAARLTKVLLYQARMSSIYEGVNHFVVVDPDNKRIEVYADTGATPGSFDADDPRVAATHFNAGVALSLPAEPASLTSPLDATALTSAWSLPEPDSDARWGSNLKGVMTTPTGRVQSAESTPATIGAGIIVFSTGQNDTAAVGIRGGEGSIRSFELFKGQWKGL